MTPAQARALLALMAECYQIASTPEPAHIPEPEPTANGQAKEPIEVEQLR